MTVPSSTNQPRVQILLVALSGLFRSHHHPFLQLHYQTRCDKSSSREVAMEVEPVRQGRQREPNGTYTAVFCDAPDSQDSNNAKTLPQIDCVLGDSCNLIDFSSDVDHINVEAWNSFQTNLSIHIASLKLSIRQFQSYYFSKGSVEFGKWSPRMWFPMQASKEHDFQSMQLRLQLCIRFIDDGNYPEIIRKHEGHDNEDIGAVPDPAFCFQWPSKRINWDLLVATNIRQIFYNMDVERLCPFHEDVLYGNLSEELEEDEEMFVDETHAQAFQLAQLSGQYLDYCIQLLNDRCKDYEEQYRDLVEARDEKLHHKRKLDHYRKSLQKEENELDTLIAIYKGLLDGRTSGKDNVEKTVSTSVVDHVPTLVKDEFSPTKPHFLKSWEEREEERKRIKEATKHERIAQQKEILQRNRKDRHDRELSVDILNEIHRLKEKRSRYRIYKWIREIIYKRLNDKMNRQATRIQTWYRCQKSIRNYLQYKMRNHELALMATEDAEIKILSCTVQDDVCSLCSDDDFNLEKQSTSFVKELVAVWKRVRRMSILAARKGISFFQIFQNLDGKHDEIIDRYELRIGLREWRIRITRKMTRALIALLRSKCGLSNLPLIFDYDQFVFGFELQDQPPLEPTIVLNDHTEGPKIQQAVNELPDEGFESEVPEPMDTLSNGNGNDMEQATTSEVDVPNIAQDKTAIPSSLLAKPTEAFNIENEGDANMYLTNGSDAVNIGQDSAAIPLLSLTEPIVTSNNENEGDADRNLTSANDAVSTVQDNTSLPLNLLTETSPDTQNNPELKAKESDDELYASDEQHSPPAYDTSTFDYSADFE